MSDSPTVHLVVGWDHYSPSTAALRFAIDMARRLNAHVHVVHIQDMDDEPLDPDCDSWESQSRTGIAAAETSARDEFSAGDVSWEYHRAHGPAAVQLLGVAQQCDALMIILGALGVVRRRHSTRFGQSVSHRLIGARRVPLVLVPAL